MSELWSYRLSDLLLFSPQTYYRLFELYHRDIWPLQLPALVGGGAILFLLPRGKEERGRIVAALLVVAWLWTAWAFHLKRYSTINWAATWFAGAFAFEGLLLLWTGVVRNRMQIVRLAHPTQWLGLGLYLFALVILPLVGVLAGRSWLQIELFGLTPDPTAAGTLGILLAVGNRPRISVLIVPLLWCAISGATLWTMHAPDALLLPSVGLIIVAFAFWRALSSPSQRFSRSSGADLS